MSKNETEKTRKHNRIPVFLLAAAGILLVLYLIVNLIFWFCGTPARFFEYSFTEGDTVSIDYYSGPFFLMNIPDTIDGKAVTQINSRIFNKTITGKDGNDADKQNPFKNFVIAIHQPDTADTLMSCAFSNCTNLHYINLPASLKSTGADVLANTKVKKLVFPDNMTEIGNINTWHTIPTRDFRNMENLEEVVLPKNLKIIGHEVFKNCSNLKTIVLPDGIEQIGYGAFAETGLTEINLPDSLTELRGCIFKGTPFEEQLAEQSENGFVILNDRFLYQYIGKEEHIKIPDGIEYICDNAFSKCSIKTVDIPDSVKYLDYAFIGSAVEELVIPDTIDPEAQLSFESCSQLKRIVLPDHLTLVPYAAFINCTALESVHIPEQASIICPHAFEGCKALKEVTLPEGVQVIDISAFHDSGLETINIPESVEVIYKSAFLNTPFEKANVTFNAEE